MNLTSTERETIIRFDNESEMATVCTFQRGVQAQIVKLAKKHPTMVRITKTYADGDGVIAEMPKTWVGTMRPPKKVVLTEKQKKSRSDNMKANRKNRSANLGIEWSPENLN